MRIEAARGKWFFYPRWADDVVLGPYKTLGEAKQPKGVGESGGEG